MRTDDLEYADRALLFVRIGSACAVIALLVLGRVVGLL
jgi:hypothetical protein